VSIDSIQNNFDSLLDRHPKTHKDIRNPPLRPIVSQIGTVTYSTAKYLNSVITPYMNKHYMIESTYEFIQIARTTESPKCLASLDVVSLFTNVPVKETIKIILDAVYGHPSKSPPKIPRIILEELILICTTQTPFKSPNGQLYQQVDGVSMGTPLGPTLANFYMSHLENNIFSQNLIVKPTVYCRYIDDIFLVIDNVQDLEKLKKNFEENSILQFTYELETKKQIPFLDTLVSRTNSELTTTVFRKETSSSECLNYHSYCPLRYKTGVINNFLHRAYAICSTWELFSIELERIQQLLVNNNYPNYLIQNCINKFLQRKFTNSNNCDAKANTSTAENRESNSVKFYFKNQMTEHYKREERELKKIFSEHVLSNTESNQTKLLIYYKNRKLSQLFIKNNPNKPSEIFNVVYKYACDVAACKDANAYYVGYTTTTVKERFRQHASIKKHHQITHNSTITGKQMLQNVSILAKGRSKQELLILEALLIKELNPVINKQTDDFNATLKVF